MKYRINTAKSEPKKRLEDYLNNKLELYKIPEDIETIREYAFYGNSNLKKIILHNSIKTISNYAFYNCKYIELFEFRGTKSEWNSISKEDYWDSGSNITTITCSDGEVYI